ncbi:cytochrome P450 [Collybia nuda]|uniref:Cytochrome P450 n=1 Tax=Collybia nuda TaxID=64659 RepID=A0A9P5Y1C4_9AGAR|nr:cytochrome P450 [Collybia nuda]
MCALPWLIGICLSFFFAAPFCRVHSDKNGIKIPHGPCGFPFIGSFLSLTRFPELSLHAWYKIFGDIYSFRVGNQLFIAISDPGVIKDLMITNGAIFSSRKDMFIKAQTIFLRRGITGTGCNKTWRKHRQLAQSYLQRRCVEGMIPSLDKEATLLVKNLFEDSKGGLVPLVLRRYSGHYMFNNMMKVTFGIRIKSVFDPIVVEALRISREFMNCTGPVNNLVDFVPFLQHFQTPILSRALQFRKDAIALYGGLIDDMKARMKVGEEVPDCFIKKLLDVKEEEKLDDLDIVMLGTAFMIAGVETPSGLIQWFAAHLSTLPEIQRKAHDELDKVIGRERLPTIEDQNSLPYCRAIIKEVQRYHNPFWLGTPHSVTEDFIYRGYYIPKDTVVVCNTYSIHFNASRYPDPFNFEPERYLDDPFTSVESVNLADPYKRDHWMFGVGRRICIGMFLADKMLFLVISRMLWAYSMSEVLGEAIDLREYDGQSGRSPLSFRINLAPRHEGVARVLNVES